MVSEKDKLRLAMRARRKEFSARLTPEEYCQRIAQQLLPHLTDQDVIAGYWPIGSELDCRPLLSLLFDKGYALCLPRVTSSKILTFHTWYPGQDLEKDKKNILAPGVGTPTLIPSVILVPLLAFDKQGNRLGQGQGYYDATLAYFQPRLAIGLAFSCQEVDHVPKENHDHPLNFIITELIKLTC